MIKLGFSITFKLLLVVLPLVCLPIAGVGYFSYQTSVDRITNLSRKEQLLKAEAAAARIDDIFRYCKRDIETLVQLPIISDYYSGEIYGLAVDTEFIRDKIVNNFQNFLARSPFYFQIRFFDQQGKVIANVNRDRSMNKAYNEEYILFPDGSESAVNNKLLISNIQYSSLLSRHMIYFAKSIINTNGEFAGVIEIDVDYEKVMDLIKAIRVGETGYAFMVDQYARTIAHPFFKPYEFDLTKYPTPRLREFIIYMMTGETGWKDYYYNGEKTAAYAPIPSIGWSLAVTIPIAELKKEAIAIRNNVIQVVGVVLVFAACMVGFVSYRLLHPIKNLVIATEKIAEGDLDYKIPVQSGDELGKLTRSFNSMIKELNKIQTELVRSEKLISMGRLSSGVAHEIRNPLNAMKGAIVFMQKKRSDDRFVNEYTNIILEEINRLNEFVTEFLYFARQSEPKCIPTDLNAVINNTVNLFEEEIRKNNISVNKILDKTLPMVDADPHQLGQVYVNLLVNAIQAMPEGGSLELRSLFHKVSDSSNMSGMVVIEIRDSGTGIPRTQLKNIFDPFFSTKDKGTGLGLPISLGIVEAHGGNLRIFSSEGEGTIAVIEIPVKVAVQQPT